MGAPVIAGNWKMNKTPQEGRTFARQLSTKALNLPEVDFILFPSATGLQSIHEALVDTAIEMGGQNMHHEQSGAFTGENSAEMLVACGCQWVLIGHSERRHVFAEPAVSRPLKVATALGAGLKVMLCVGELLEQREQGRTEEVLREQLSNDLGRLRQFPVESVVIAYEPVWAIGTGVVATTQQAGEAHGMVRGVLDDLYPDDDPGAVIVVYGGSVKSSNAAELISTPGIDGFLIGGASLELDEFVNIAEIAKQELRSA